MILTYKLKHNRDFSPELTKARQIAEVALKTRTQSSKDVKQYGLKSIISNQILREYARNRKLKKIGNVNLIIPNQGISVSNRTIGVPSLKLEMQYQFPNKFKKINQIEIDNEYAYVSVSIEEPIRIDTKGYIGVDRNTTGHIAVVANPKTGKVWKFGKESLHIHNTYKNTRRRLQKKGKYGIAQRIRNRESNKIRDLNHKTAKAIVEVALLNQTGIKLEKLDGIRRSRKHTKSFNYSLSSWSFRQLQGFVEYKAKLSGIPIAYVEPKNTSKECSRCGDIGTREAKKFVCHSCGHVDHADANASFNIGLRPPLVEGMSRLHADRDVCKGSTDTPQEATARMMQTPNLQTEYAQAERNPITFSGGRMSEWACSIL